MARTKFRPTRKWMDSSIKLVVGHNGTEWRRIPAGEKIDSPVKPLFSMPDNKIRKGNVIRPNGTIEVEVFFPPLPTASNNAKRSLLGKLSKLRYVVADHGGKGLVFSEEPMANGVLCWRARFKCLADKAILFQQAWTGKVTLQMNF